ncbi:C6 finger domain protein [Aspergillus pseudoustus]|uniref:C6 finger domain protein n=1 Tax=Aspergillus pseudoustus TaxID=1810923 RepID=A0ABR4IYC5_9EURO
MPTPKRRFHGGCWTCKVKHRKCDRSRPTCQTCNERGVPCDGYEVRLQWGSGIASRGRFVGAEVPVASSTPASCKGRRRDRVREEERQAHTAERLSGGSGRPLVESAASELGPVHSALWVPESTLEDAQLFQDFLASGINILHSTTVYDVENTLGSRLPTLCAQSDALYSICITLQISLNPALKTHFLEYFDAALIKFRNELSRTDTYLENGTLAAGLLFCTIGIMHGIPWTMHLRGMYSIIRSSSAEKNTRNPDGPFRGHLFEVMGIMDLPTFAVGRQYPNLGFWRQYCRERSLADPASHQKDVEIVSGLPRSLVDIFSCIGHGATEADFWDWPGVSGNFLQCQLWEAHRLAGMLAIREGNLLPSTQAPRESQSRSAVRPPTAVLVSRILSCVDAIYRASVEPEGRDTLIINATPYPLFVAGLQTDTLAKDPSLKEYLRRFLRHASTEPFCSNQYRIMLDLLEEYWMFPPGTVNIHQLAQARDVELGLF